MRVSIIVKSNAKENKVDLPRIFVKEPAKEGKANESVIKLLAKHFNVSKSRINIILGLKSKKKIIKIK
jgi:uncharacterized protein YggU (UPF0235/DUF167 family)